MAVCWFRSAREDAVPLLSVRQLPQGSLGPQLPDTKGGRDGGYIVYGDMLEPSGDSQEAVCIVDSDVALALAGVCYSCSAQQSEKSEDAQQYEATQPL